jgi:hypothetical protein
MRAPDSSGAGVMQYHRQLIKHDPANGMWGDCFRTCIACLLDLDCPMQVPHVMHGADDGPAVDKALAKMNKWLSDVWGLRYVEMPFTHDNLSPAEFLKVAARFLGDEQRYILTAQGTNDVPHAVVCRGSELEHCPAGRGLDGITGAVVDDDTGGDYYWLGLLIKEL